MKGLMQYLTMTIGADADSSVKSSHHWRASCAGQSAVKVALALVTLLGAGFVQADGLASDYDSYPPTLVSADLESKSNVLFMLDTSESMEWTSKGDKVGSNHKTSRVVIARQAIGRIMDQFHEQVNMGLMAFEPTPNFSYYLSTSKNKFGTKEYAFNSCCWAWGYEVREGFLYIPIGSIDSEDGLASTAERIDDFDDMLGLSIVSQTLKDAENFYDLYKFDGTSYLNGSDAANRRIPTEGSTPIAGTFMSARQYYTSGIAASQRASTVSSTEAVWPAPAAGQCAAKDFAILLTDGAPTVKTNGEVCTTSCVGQTEWQTAVNAEGKTYYTGYTANKGQAAWIDETLAEAKALYDAGVPTYVIGLGLSDAEKFVLGKIAEKSGTDQAYYADDLDELMVQLNLIFANITTRTSSGTGAAVIANRGSGLSADIQALFTPEKTSNSGQTVKWVGTLQSFFIDDNGLPREDTDGDGMLDDYTVDRILEFVYDEAKDITLVDRKLSTNATDPNAIDASSIITSELEDIAAIWNLRDRLAEISDVLTQRTYSTSASSGRAIYTSVDGETLLDFVQVDEQVLVGLEDDEADLYSDISKVEGDIFGDATDPDARDLVGGLAGDLDKLETLLTAGSDPVDPNLIDALTALQAELDAQKAGLESTKATKDSELIDAQNTVDTELGQLNQAQADLDAEQGQLTAAQAALDQAIADKAIADQAVTDTSAALTQATSDRDAAQTALTAAQTAQSTAQTERNTAATAVTDAQTDVTAAEGVVTTETADRNAANTALGQAITDFNTAQTAFNNADSAYNTALATANTENSEAAAAETIRDDAAADLQVAQDDLTALQNQTSPPANPNDIDDAQIVVDNAQAAYDTAQSNYLTEQGQADAANTALGTATTNRTNALNTLNTETTDRNNAQSAYDQAVADLTAAESDLTAKKGVLSAAETELATKEGNLTAANTDVATKQGLLDTAITDLGTATDDYNAAVSAQTAAGGLVTSTTETRDLEQADIAPATSSRDTEQNEYNAAVAVRDPISDEVVRLAKMLSEVDTAAIWTEGIFAEVALLDILTDKLRSLAQSDATAREALVKEIDDRYKALKTLLDTPPAVASDNDETKDLPGLITNVRNELGDVLAVLDDKDDVNGLNSVAELAAEIDTQMDVKEDLEAQLASKDSAIDAIDYIRYMDDNIPGQSGDADLSYTERSNIVAWIRGEEMTDLRSRTIDFDDDNVDEVWRLGDIVHSTPAVVGRAQENYYTNYGDTTYLDYMREKFNRRQMVYVGSNTGLLHAVNAGFWDDANQGYVTQLTGSTAVAHPLGAELWAYVPKAALPHLQFVANKNYTHMALVDGAPQVFDVNIFDDDDVHPNGWGTILVVSMRLGGGEFTVRVDEDDDGTAEDVVVGPSIMIFDVTNPEDTPELIAELRHPDMGFTLGRAALIKSRQPSTDGWESPSVNEWSLVFGSGPTDLDAASSDQEARLYAYDLKAREWSSAWSNAPKTISLESNAYIGDLSVVDWDNDLVDDAVYFGLNTGAATALDGRVARLRLRSENPSGNWLSGASVGTFIDVQRTVSGAPLAMSDVYGRRWVYFGTGRILIANDKTSTQQEYFAGVREPINSDGNLTFGNVSPSSLLDITDIKITANPDKVENGPSGVETTSALIKYINDNTNGWYRELTQNGTDPSGRAGFKPVSFRNSVIFTEFVPNTSQCELGTSYLWVINNITGVPFAEVNLGLDDSGYIEGKQEYGNGLVTDITIVKTKNGTFVASNDETATFNMEGLEVSYPSLRRQSWRQIFDLKF